MNGEIKAAALRARTVYEYDDRFVAPRNGFADAEDYYARCSAQGYLAAINVPTLVVHADDDPWIPNEAYRDFAWRTNPNLTPLLSSSGGHVGFHSAGTKVAWHNLCIARFFDRVCAGA
jgi:predicted alpha/beta-fold hydrolase